MDIKVQSEQLRKKEAPPKQQPDTIKNNDKSIFEVKPVDSFNEDLFFDNKGRNRGEISFDETREIPKGHSRYEWNGAVFDIYRIDDDYQSQFVHPDDISREEFDRNHGKLSHGGFVLRTGKTTAENAHKLELSIKLDSNAEFTGSKRGVYCRVAGGGTEKAKF